MKNIFKLKRHSNRTHEISQSTVAPSAPSPSSPPPLPSPPPQPQPQPMGVSPSSIAQHPSVAPSPTSSVAAGPTLPASAAPVTQKDYYSLEEEFQMQLALAISASNSTSDDPDGDQIRAAKSLSLRGDRIDKDGSDGSAESLSRRYWDYNVLDYYERVADGFYDIFGFSRNSANQGKMPSLVDLQTSIGDLGFEVIVVNRTIDRALVELEQVAQCYSMDFPKSEIEFLVQRISELVSDHMGGPVRDANDMFTRWIEKSTESRTLQQTSLFPIGCIEVGLSRHRALLFKVLADDLGIPCRLVKGSHYTGVDDDAVNIIKLYGEREYLVDLMADPGTLIPADILSIKDSTANSHEARPRENLTQAIHSSQVDSCREETSYDNQKNEYGASTCNDKTELGEGTRWTKLMLPSISNQNLATSADVGSSSTGRCDLDQFATSKRRGFVGSLETPINSDNTRKNLKITLNSQDPSDSRNLFAELNPFQVNKDFRQYEATDVENSGFQKRQEYNAFGAGRSQVRLLLKGHSAVNEVRSANENNFIEGLLPGKSTVESNASSQFSTLNGNEYLKGLNNDKGGISSSQSVGIGSGTSTSSDDFSEGHQSSNTSEEKHMTTLKSGFGDSETDSGKYVGDNNAMGSVLQNSVSKKPSELGPTDYEMPDPKRCSYDRFLGPIVGPKLPVSSTFSLQVRPSSIDPMLDDVGEWEIPWEDLVIGERIGLGSYGEVYRADWNGKEVAVKKFLDQDFYGDALDEFRSEVRIMRRLRHRNVVRFMGAVTRPPNLSIVSEFLPRGSLYRILHRPICQIDEKRRIKMALDVAKGMNCLHTSVPTIVHRDLKSPNLLVDKNWTVKVCDFGLSRLKHNTFLSSKSTAGTPEWMAPEVLRNENSNEKCDVYSFGIILWELATLRMPWSGMNPMQVVGAVGFQDRRLDIPKEVDPLVGRIIWECWQKDPSLRPSFSQLTTALKSLQRLIIPTHQELQQNTPLPQEISVNSTP